MSSHTELGKHAQDGKLRAFFAQQPGSKDKGLDRARIENIAILPPV
jgi:hypothetical protein